jgi:hypothetical protein
VARSNKVYKVCYSLQEQVPGILWLRLSSYAELFLEKFCRDLSWNFSSRLLPHPRRLRSLRCSALKTIWQPNEYALVLTTVARPHSESYKNINKDANNIFRPSFLSLMLNQQLGTYLIPTLVSSLNQHAVFLDF